MNIKSYINKIQLNYFYTKIKIWCTNVFATLIHSHKGTEVTLTGYSKANSKSAITTSDTVNSSIGKLEYKVDSYDDTNYVHKTTDEEISGVKTFNNNLILKGDYTTYNIKKNTIIKGTSPSDNNYCDMLQVVDKNGVPLTRLYSSYLTDNTCKISLLAYKGTDDSTTHDEISIGYDANGNVYTKAPTPSTSDNSTKIATTAFVKAQGYLTSHQSLANYLPLSGGTLTGNLNGTGFYSTNGGFHVKNSNITKGTNPSSTNYWNLSFCDKDGTANAANRLGLLESSINSNGVVSTYIRALENKANSTTACQIACIYDTANSLAYTSAPTPVAGDNSTKIATTAWVQTFCGTTKKYLTAHQSLDSCVKTSGGQTISGTKQFTNWPVVLHNGPGVVLKDQDFTHTGSDHPSGSIEVKDKNDVISGSISFHDYANNAKQRAWSVYIRPAISTTAGYISYHFYQGNDVVYVPGADNSYHFGTNSSRWAQFHAGTSSIATSDEREKTILNDISENIFNAWNELDFCQYKFNDAINKKGINNARIHTGLIAQRIKSVFSKYNLNAHDYGFFCYDEWEEEQEQLDSDGTVLTPYKPAGNRYALRYEEALCMEAAYQRRKVKQLEEEIVLLKEEIRLLKEAILNK